MFYEHNQVEDLLICANCNERYDIPLLLPCWKSICGQCAKSAQLSPNRVLNCPYCTLIHEIPKNGMPINDALNTLLKLKPVDMHRAGLLREITELLRNLKSGLLNLDTLELNVHNELIDYFDLIKKEINKSAQNLIEQAIKQRDKLINDLDYLKEQTFSYLKNDLFFKTSFFNETKLKLKQKFDFFNQSLSKYDESLLNKMILETKEMNAKLDEIQQYINATLNSNKLVYDQPEPLSNETSLVGQLDFNYAQSLDHKLKIKYLNNLNKVKCLKLDEAQLMRNCVRVLPVMGKRLLVVNKLNYDEFDDYLMKVIDFNGKISAFGNESLSECRLNACGSFFNYILVSVTEKKTGRDLIKLFNTSLQLIKSCVLEFKCERFFFNDDFFYAQFGSTHFPFLLKFDYSLNKFNLFDDLKKSTTNELFISFSVDKLIHISSSTNRMFFSDMCFSRIKIYSELNGGLLDTVSLNGLRDAAVAIRVDESLVNHGLAEQFIYLNKNERVLRVFDAQNGQLIAENFLSDVIKNISSFYLTKDGCYVFVDYLNDSVYIY